MDDEYMEDSLGKGIIIGVIIAVGCVAALIGLYGVTRFYSIVKREPPKANIKWLQTPLGAEKDEKGNISGYLMLGADENGFAHLGHAPVPQQSPTSSQGPTPPLPTQVHAKK